MEAELVLGFVYGFILLEWLVFVWAIRHGLLDS